MCGQDRPVGKALRRLRRVQAGARDGFGNRAVARLALQRLCQRHGRKRTLSSAYRRDGAVDQIVVDEGPDGIMDQHDLGRCRAQRTQSKERRFLTGGAAMHETDPLALAGCLLEKRLVVAVNGHRDPVDERMGEEGFDRVGDDGLAGKQAVLLRPVGSAGAFAPPCGDQHDGGFRGGFWAVFGHAQTNSRGDDRKPAHSRKRHNFTAEGRCAPIRNCLRNRHQNKVHRFCA